MTTILSLRRTGAVLAAAAIAAGTAAPASAADAHADTQAVLNAYQSHAGPGAAVYAGNATGSWHLSAGSATVTPPARPIRPDDHIRIASQTKTFTAAVILQLVDEGKVALDAPIERYLPGLVDGNGYDGNRITVRQILQHTSGIASPNVLAYARKAAGLLKPDGSVELRDLVRVGLRNFPPASQPGAAVLYSNLGYLVNGLLIEQVTGMSVGEAITSRIIRPLGLTRTSFPRPGDRSMPAPYSPGYLGERVGPFFFWTETTSALFLAEPSIESSAGAVVSTMTDLSAFYRALLDGKVISRAALAEMRRTVQVPVHDPNYVGLGLGIEAMTLPCGGEAWFHSGIAVSGYTSFTAATDDGRYASMVTNAVETSSSRPAQINVIESALCGSR